MTQTKWGSPVEIERRNRIRLSVAAYAYEFEDDPIMSDAEFDNLAKEIDVRVETGNEELDQFFRKHFESYTGSWVHDHPDISGLQRIYNRQKEKRND